MALGTEQGQMTGNIAVHLAEEKEVLRNNDIYTLENLVKTNENDFKHFVGICNRVWKSIYNYLESLGLRFGMNDLDIFIKYIGEVEL